METVLDRTEAQLRFGNALMASPTIAAVLRRGKKLAAKKGDDLDTEYICISSFFVFELIRNPINYCFTEGIVLDLVQGTILVHRFLGKIISLDPQLQTARKVIFTSCHFQI